MKKIKKIMSFFILSIFYLNILSCSRLLAILPDNHEEKIELIHNLTYDTFYITFILYPETLNPTEELIYISYERWKLIKKDGKVTFNDVSLCIEDILFFINQVLSEKDKEKIQKALDMFIVITGIGDKEVLNNNQIIYVDTFFESILKVLEDLSKQTDYKGDLKRGYEVLKENNKWLKKL